MNPNFEFQDLGVGNCTKIGANIRVEGVIEGNNNIIEIGEAIKASEIKLIIQGNGNRVSIGSIVQVKGLFIRIGTHVLAHGSTVIIGDDFSAEWSNSFLLPNSGNSLQIGSQCLFSNSITIRCGESPHLIFDRQSGEYLDRSSGVTIGSHVWVGEGVYITKRSSIAKDSIVAARSVVTKKFDESYAVLAGNPARVTRRNVEWVRNPSMLDPDSAFFHHYQAWRSEF